jgi:hypothetical protein
MEYIQEIFTYRIRIDARGYQSALSQRIRPQGIPQSNMVCDFKLKKAAVITAAVHSHDGTPISGADVVIATHLLQIINGTFDSRSSEQNLTLQTDANGRFHFEPPITPYVIVVVCEQGYARVTPDEFATSKTITLSPWGHIEGTLRIGSQPGADRLVAFLHESRSQEERPRVYLDYKVRTDEDGHFAFTRVFPGEGLVTRAIPIGNRGWRSSHSVSVEIKPGQTTRVQIGGTGRPVIGKVIIPDVIKDTFDWQHTDHSLRVSSPDSPYRTLALNFDEDGSFRTDDVPAGNYTIQVFAYGPPPNSRTYRGERIGLLSRAFSIPKIPSGRSDEPFDLGQLELEVIGISDLMPSLIGKSLPDLSPMKIEPAPVQADGKMILICFWDMDQRPSRRCITRLAEQAAELKGKDVMVLTVQASKAEQSTLDEWVKKNNIPFPVAMVKGDAQKVRFAWGVKSLPWLILTDSRHVVTAEGFGLSDLDERIEAAK